MTRSLSTVLVTVFSLVGAPAFAQQPIAPQPVAPQYGQPTPPPQYGEVPQYTTPPTEMQPQPGDPYAAQGDDDDEDGYDITYDVSTQQDPSQDYDDGYDPNAYQQFESQLSPYGSWEDTGSYGRVWVPSPGVVGSDFAPYDTDGHFAMSDYGWTWDSDYSWGWAPFHYGRWMVIGGRGWCWLPGTKWGPAWVNWRFGGGYAGWAPMGPRGVVVGPPRGTRGPWRFTVAGQLGAAHPAYLPARVMPSVWGRTAAIHNVANVTVGGVGVRINAGPSAAMMTAATGRAIAPVPLASLAPRALPRAGIVARPGVALAARPWMQSRPVGGSFARPVVGAHTLGSPAGARPIAAPRPLGYRGNYAAAAPQYHAPAPMQYRAPAQSYHYAQPTYRAPVQSYHYAQPTYRAPAYSAPVYSSPSFHVSSPAPSYHMSAPAPAPVMHSGGGFSGGGGFHGGGGGHGGRR